MFTDVNSLRERDGDEGTEYCLNGSRVDGDGVPLGEISADRAGDCGVVGEEDELDKKHYLDYAAPSRS